MIKPEDEIIIDLSTSCTKEAAVAKLLGWLKGPIRSKVTLVTEHGIPEDKLPFLHSMEGSLKEQLRDLRESARQNLVAASERDASYEEMETAEKAVSNAEQLFEDALRYLSEIDEELGKDKESEILIDREKTEQTGVTHLTLPSLDRWARRKYGIRILEDPETRSPDKKTQEREEDLDPKRGLSKTVADNLYVSFAFLVEALARSVPIFNKGSSGPNNAAISRRIAVRGVNRSLR